MIIKNKMPFFKRGEILDSQILENLRDTPYEFYSLAYNNFFNGVITGLSICVEKNFIIIKPGIIKYNNYYYRINKTIKIEVPLEDGDYILKIKFNSEKLVDLEKYSEHSLEVLLDLNEANKDGEMELGRIKRREGAEIKNLEGFLGIEKEYNLISEINKPQSIENGIVPSINILKLFARKMIENKETEPMDENFCMNILCGKITREALDIYLMKKLNVDSMNSSNEEIYLFLTKIYVGLRNSIKSRNKRIISKDKIIVE